MKLRCAFLAVLPLLACSRARTPPSAVVAGDEVRSVPVGVSAELDGSGSTPGAQHQWMLALRPAGSAAVLGGGDQPRSWIVPDVEGLYLISLSVSDGLMTSEPRTVRLQARCGRPPLVAIDPPPVPPHVGQAVSLSATVTWPDAACAAPALRGFRWSLVEQPLGSRAALREPGDTAPILVPDRQGRYRLVLEVTDAQGRTGRGERALEVEACGNATPVVTDLAAAPAPAVVGQPVKLSAQVSDADNGGSCALEQALSRAWRFAELPRGSLARIAPADGDAPQFVPDVPGRYAVELTAADGTGRSGKGRLEIEVAACGRNAPQVVSALAAPPESTTGGRVRFSAAVEDADTTCGLPGGYALAWRIAAAPAGSAAALSDSAADEPWMETDRPGPYALEVTATDRTGLTGEAARVELQATTCGDGWPVALVTGSSGGVGQPVALEALASDPDEVAPCSRPLEVSWRWWVEALPPGAHAALQGMDGPRPWFVADQPGLYRVRAVATDATGRASEPSGAEIDVAACGGARPTVTAAASPPSPNVGATVSLAAAAGDADTTAPCSRSVSFTWRWWFEEMPAGSAATLNGAALRTPSFVADLAGTYRLRVVATDETGRSSAPAPVEVKVQACGGAAPVARPSASPAGPAVGQRVQLDARASDDDDLSPCSRDTIFGYRWWIEERPAGSRAELSSGSLRAPGLVPDAPGRYVAVVMATDDTGRSSAPAQVAITASPCGAAAPTVSPLASPAGTRNKYMSPVGQTVRLDAGASDADTGCGLAATLSYRWWFEERPAGSGAQLVGQTTAAPSFIPDAPGRYLLRVVATGETGRTSEVGAVAVEAALCGSAAPEAAPSHAPASPNAGEPVVLSAGASDADSETPCGRAVQFRYRWWFAELPPGSQAALSDPTLPAPRFTADLPGTYALMVEVRDETGRSSGAVGHAFQVSSCGANAPTASGPRTSPASAVVGAPLMLLADLGDADTACGLSQEIAARWRMLSAPAGSQARLADPPGFVPDLAGPYVLDLVATDSTGRSSPAASLTVNVDACGAAPPSATVSAIPSAALLGQPVLLAATLSDPDNGPPCPGLGVPTQKVVAHWALAEAPPGSRASLLSSDGSSMTSLVPDVRGTYVAEVVPEDSTGRLGAPVRVSITGKGCGDNRPLAFIQGTSPEVEPDSCVNAVRDLDLGTVSGCTLAVPPPFQIDAVCSRDLDNDPSCAPMKQDFRYEWNVIQQPVGSTAQIQPSTDGRNAWFQIDRVGDYRLGMRVFDGTAWSEWATVHMAQAVLGPPVPTYSSTNDNINTFGPSVRTNSDGSALSAFRPDTNPDGSGAEHIRIGRCTGSCNLAASWKYAAVDCAGTTGVSLNRYRDDPLAYELAYIRGSELYFARCSGATDDRCFNQPGGGCVEAPPANMTRVNVSGASANAQLATTFAQARAPGVPGSNNIWIAFVRAIGAPGLAFCPAGGSSCNSSAGWCLGNISTTILGTANPTDGEHLIGLHAMPDGSSADVLVAVFRSTNNNGDLVFRTCRNTVNTCPGATCLTATNWTEVVVDQRGADDGDFASVWRTACDAPREQGRIHVGYVDETNGFYRYATCLPDSSPCPRIDPGDRCRGVGGWTRINISDSPTGGGVPSTSMFVSPKDGLPRIAVHHHDGTFGLRLATNRLTSGVFDAANWRISDVVCGNAGHEPSLWIHSDGTVRVGHSQGYWPYALYFYEP